MSIGGEGDLIQLSMNPTEWEKGRCQVDGVATIQGFECLFYNVLQFVMVFAGIVFFIMFVSAGYKYFFTGGDPKKIAAASASLTNAFIGLIGVICSIIILRLIQNFTGVNITDFVIPSP